MDINNDFKSVEKLWGQEESANFKINIEGDTHVFTEGANFTSSSASWFSGEHETDFGKADGNKKDVVLTNINTGVKITQHYEFFGNCIRQHNTVKNIGKNPFTVINFTSASFGIDCSGILSWCDERRYKIHWCNSTWTCEGQWKEGSFSDLGFAPVRLENTGLPYRHEWRSEGSWSTGRYYPLIIVEDLEKGITYFAEHEGGQSWEISIGRWGNDITVDLSCANIHHDCWSKTLNENEEYSTSCAVYGKIKGTFEDAVRELTEYKRSTSLRKWNGNIPVCYNVFMGGLWGEPNAKELIPLIDAVADAGAEIFCIDAGWYRPANDPAKMGLLGDYVPDQNRFGEYGLKGILEYIKKKGMIPGLWFEFEAVNSATDGGKIKNGMVVRNGKVVSADRGIFDLRNKAVREHLLRAIDNAYKLGMRYIKNDHNFSTGIGFGSNGENYSENVREMADAFYSFIDEIYLRYPDIIIENCGSGAMRSDNGTLSHFHLQSTSDQEIYFNNPAIIQGSLAVMPPEKAGIWVYPYATTAQENNAILYENMKYDEIVNRYIDGEATVFNMVNGFMGCMYLSGRLDFADEKNKALIKKAVELYKQNTEFIMHAHGIFPDGNWANGKKGFTSLGLKHENKILLAVWKINSYEDIHTIDLSKYDVKNIKMIYPDNKNCEFTFAESTKMLTVKMTGASNMARLFEAEI